MKQNGKKKIAELSAGGDAAVNGSFLAGDGSDVTVALFADGSAQPRYTATVPAGGKERQKIHRRLRHSLGRRRNLHHAGVEE